MSETPQDKALWANTPSVIQQPYALYNLNGLSLWKPWLRLTMAPSPSLMADTDLTRGLGSKDIKREPQRRKDSSTPIH